MRLSFAILVGKFLRLLTRVRGGGSAFPGLIALKLVPDILERTLGALSGGVVFVTGSNGKSTTTTMAATILRHNGTRVFTNPAGGNLPQGLASAVIAAVTLSGRVKADVSVLEVDEAYGPQISRLLRPDWLAVTNIQIDQLNRFGEPERVLSMIRELAESTRRGVVINSADPNVAHMGTLMEAVGKEVVVVGASDTAVASQAHGVVAAPLFFEDSKSLVTPPVIVLKETHEAEATLVRGAEHISLSLPATGLHYALDAALAVGIAESVSPEHLDAQVIREAFAEQAPVYGRGETIQYRGRDVSLTMMKNLPSLQVNLSAMKGPLEIVWIAVDEGTPDPSWIFDVDLQPVDHVDVLTGTKAWQWALLCEYRGLSYGSVIEDTKTALDAVVALPHSTNQPVHAIVNYEQMMLIRRIAGYKNLEGAR